MSAMSAPPLVEQFVEGFGQPVPAFLERRDPDITIADLNLDDAIGERFLDLADS
jgi:hypothetical protein